MIRNCEIKGDGVSTATAVQMTGRVSAKVHNVVFYNNKAHEFGDMDTDTDQDAAALIVADYCSDIWILNNEFYHCTAGVRTGGAWYTESDPDNSHHIYIGYNKIHHILQNGLAIKYGTDHIYSQNEIYSIIDTKWSPSKGIGFQYAPKRLWIIGNIIYDCNNGIRAASDDSRVDTSVYMIGNIIKDIHIDGTSVYGQDYGLGIDINDGHGPRYIANNTIYDVDVGISNSYYRSQMYIYNNIIADVDVAHIFLHSEYGSFHTSSADYNLFDLPVRIFWDRSVVYDLPAFKDTGECEHCLSGNVNFVNPQGDNFRLSQSSPAIDMGADLSIYNYFESLYGISIRKDVNNVVRPQNDAWDIGAYEYVGTGNYADEDVNQDGAVTVNDVQIVVNVILGTTSNNRADVNGSGTTDVQDVQAVVNEVIG